MIQLMFQVLYTTLRVAAWACVALLCVLCGCGDDADESRYGQVAARPTYERALLPTPDFDADVHDAAAASDWALEGDIAKEFCTYCYHQTYEEAGPPQYCDPLFLKICRKSVARQTAVCHTAMRGWTLCWRSVYAEEPEAEGYETYAAPCQSWDTRTSSACDFGS